MVVGGEDVPDTATPDPVCENGIASAPAVPSNNRGQLSTAKTSTWVFMLSLAAGAKA